jgi:hypothetical protein
MPVELTIVETTTELDTVVTEVILESASTPGPAGVGVPSGGTTGQALVKASNADYDTEWDDVVGGGADDQTAAEVPFTPAGSIAATDVQAAIVELDTEKAPVSHSHSGADITSGTVAEARIDAAIARDSEVSAAIAALSTVYQPLDSDLTSIAALSTTAFGRGLLELANSAALLAAAGAAAASHAHAGEDITSGTIAEARIHADIARDSEVSAAIAALSTVYQPLDSDLTSIAALTTTAFGRGLLELADAAALRAAVDLEPGTDIPSLSTFNDHSARHEDGGADEISIQGLAGTPLELTNHLNDSSDAHDASAISVADSGGNYTATDVEGVLAEIAPQLGGTTGHAADGWVDDTATTWTYASATTFTVTGDQTAKFSKGTRIKLTQTTVKYFVAVDSSFGGGNTTVTITGGDDYTLANAAISANYYSYAANPQGYPCWFDWTPTYGGFSADPPTTIARFAVVGRQCMIELSTGNGTSNSSTFSITLPITDVTSGIQTLCRVGDNGTNQTLPGKFNFNGDGTATVNKDLNNSGFTGSGSKYVIVITSYEF